MAIVGDVGRREDVDALFRQTSEQFGTMDLLVNNAADLRRVAFFEVDESSYITGQVIYVDGGATMQLGAREQPI